MIRLLETVIKWHPNVDVNHSEYSKNIYSLRMLMHASESTICALPTMSMLR